MSQVFRPRANAIAILVLVAIVAVVVVGGGIAWLLVRSSYYTGENIARVQPIAFSHKHHVQGLGLDCRYCHTGVEKSAFAGMPSTHTCMTCHSQIFSKSPALAQVRDSFANEKPIEWRRIQKLPDFVYFNHSIHVKRGVSCETCHGEVKTMPLTRKTHQFYMRECLECHRAVAKTVHDGAQLTNCSTCHR